MFSFRLENFGELKEFNGWRSLKKWDAAFDAFACPEDTV
jgi:hypothetical protein